VTDIVRVSAEVLDMYVNSTTIRPRPIPLESFLFGHLRNHPKR